MHLDLGKQEGISLMGSAVLMLLISRVQASNLVNYVISLQMLEGG